jgi:hypothetical protein
LKKTFLTFQLISESFLVILFISAISKEFYVNLKTIILDFIVKTQIVEIDAALRNVLSIGPLILFSILLFASIRHFIS